MNDPVKDFVPFQETHFAVKKYREVMMLRHLLASHENALEEAVRLIPEHQIAIYVDLTEKIDREYD